jgi:hypothetical protein
MAAVTATVLSSSPLELLERIRLAVTCCKPKVAAGVGSQRVLVASDDVLPEFRRPRLGREHVR